MCGLVRVPNWRIASPTSRADLPAVFLGWKLDLPGPWDPSYFAARSSIEQAGFFRQAWSAGARRSLPAGTEVWLVVQDRRRRGLAGHGVTAADPHPAGSGDVSGSGDLSGSGGATGSGPGQDRMQVLVDFDALLPEGEQIPLTELERRVPGVHWNTVRSGVNVPAEAVPLLRALWAATVPPAADPTAPVPGTLPAEAFGSTRVNRYEQDPEARRLCLAFHGTACAACGFSFEAVFGRSGNDLIQVHHLVPGIDLEPGYELDPVADLVPLCPNCHAMSHRGIPVPYTTAELRRMIGEHGHLTGKSPSPRELQAQRDAATILGLG